jgi:two-component system nitrogen regulation response regulator GlnG
LDAAAVAELELHLLAQVLRHTRGSQLQAARLLGISRNSLRGKLRALGLTIERSVRSPRWSS